MYLHRNFRSTSFGGSLISVDYYKGLFSIEKAFVIVNTYLRPAKFVGLVE